MLDPIKHSINLLQSLAACLNPIKPDESNLQHIPYAIGQVGLVPNALECKRKREYSEERGTIEDECEYTHTFSTYGVVQYLWRVKIEKWSPTE